MNKDNWFHIRRRLLRLNAARCELLGGFACELTAEEQNQWHEFIRHHETRVAYRAKHLETEIYEARVKGGEIDDVVRLRDLAQQTDALFEQLYDIGKQWYAALVAEREKAAAAEEQSPDSQAPATEATPR